MKKIVLSTLLASNLLMASNAILGEVVQNTEESPSMISFDAGMWYMSWNQTSTSADMLKNSSDALDVNYNIDDSMAAQVALKVNYGYLSGSLDYTDSSSSSDNGDGISSLDVGLALLDYIPFLDVEMRYVKSDFSGSMSAKDSGTGNYGTSDFTTSVEIYDIILYPFNKYLGVGYRSYSYEFPQDVYITRDSDGTLLAGGSGLLDLAYEGYFYTLALDNKKMVDARNNYNGFIYSITAGYGKLTPSALQNEKADAATVSLVDSYLGESDALFYDVLLGYSYKKKDTSGFGYGVTAGYRYNKIEADESEDVNNGGYSIKTKFDTEFYGPYVSLVFSY